AEARLGVIVARDRVVEHGFGWSAAPHQPVARDVGKPHVGAGPGGAARDVHARQPDRATGNGLKPAQHLFQLELTVALDARHTDDLAGVDGEVDAVKRAKARLGAKRDVIDRQNWLARGAVRMPFGGQVVSHHEPHQLLLGRVLAPAGSYHPAAPEDRDVVRDLEDLFELVSDDYDGVALAYQTTEIGRAHV